MIDQPTIDAIADAIAKRLSPQPVSNPYVLNRKQAKHYVGKLSDDAFDDWCHKHKVKRCGHGRYAIRHLDRALELEARVRA